MSYGNQENHTKPWVNTGKLREGTEGNIFSDSDMDKILDL